MSTAPFFAVASNGRVQIRRNTDNVLLADFAPFGSYTGPVSVAIGDVNNSGAPALITGTGVGQGQVKIFDGQAIANGSIVNGPDSHLLANWFPFPIQFNVGVNVAVGDIEGTGFPDIVVGAAAGNPDVRVYRGQDIANNVFDPNGSSLLVQFFPYGLGFNIGANVALGDINHDGFADLVTGPTAGNPDVRVFNGRDLAHRTLNLLAQFFAYGLQFNIGAFVAVGDVQGNNFPDIITGASTGNPQAKVYRGTAIASFTFDSSNPDASLLTQFFAFDLGQNIGVTVGSGDIEMNGRWDLVTGPTTGPPTYRVIRGSNAFGLIPPALFIGTGDGPAGPLFVGA
jgi:hypothetical protein